MGLPLSTNFQVSTQAGSSRFWYCASVDRPATVLAAEETASRILRRGGYHVIDIADGQEIFDYVRDFSPDVAVIDAVLPRLSGLDVCRQLQVARTETRVLLVAAKADAASRIEGLRAGADDFLGKPFDPEELKARVEALLRRRGRAEARSEASIDGDLDPLTGLPGQRLLTRRLEEQLTAAPSEHQPLSLMAIDLDGFGAVNSRFGRSAGDRLLKACARSIVRVSRDEDLVVRAGGDEFVVLMPGLHFSGCIGAAERAWREIAATTVVEAGARISCVTSIGVASYPGKDIETARDLLRLAHAALARAKDEGQGICLYQHHGYLYHPDVIAP